MTTSRPQLLTFMQQEAYAVQASVSAGGTPQAAVVGVVVSDRFEVFFEPLGLSRKIANLRRHPAVALVLGPTDAGAMRTVQCEGIADEPTGADLERLLELYFTRFPDGRARKNLPDITYVRVTPTWIRYSDFSLQPPEIVEWRETRSLRLPRGSRRAENPHHVDVSRAAGRDDAGEGRD